MPITEQRLVARADIRRVVRGEQLDVTIEVFDEISNEALDLSELDTAAAALPGANGTPVNVTPTVITDAAGRLLMPLATADTQLLNVGTDQSYELELTFDDGTVRIVQLVEALDVDDPLF